MGISTKQLKILRTTTPMRILAIDPGNTQSGYVLLNMQVSNTSSAFTLISHGVLVNLQMLQFIEENKNQVDVGLIEMIQSYGMAVGNTVFDTCVWVGRFHLRMTDNKWKSALVFRKSILNYHLGATNVKSPDSKILKLMKSKYPVESKGVKSHSWQALALAAMYFETSQAA